MARVAMIVSNSCNPDPRVEKEAISLALEGYEVTIHAFDRLEDSVENYSLNYKVKTRVKNIIKSVYEQSIYEDFYYEN